MYQKNADAKSGRMEVEVAVILFSCSMSKHNFRYMIIVPDGHSAMFSALQENIYGLVPIVNKQCLNHVGKRMETALCNLVQRSEEPLGETGTLTTKALTNKLTDYYGKALQNNSNNVVQSTVW